MSIWRGCSATRSRRSARSRRAASIRYFDALSDNRGDAVSRRLLPPRKTASAPTFTRSVLSDAPARFAARIDSPIRDVLPELLEAKKIAVVAGTAHEAYLKAMFTEAELRPYPTDEAARAALRNKESRLLFGDAYRLRSGSTAPIPVAVRVPRRPVPGKPFFGEGVGIAVKRGKRRVAAKL